MPEIHAQGGVEISERTVGHLLNRYDEVLAVSLTDSRRLREQQGRVILAVDGLQPDVGHEVLWVVRECVSGEIMLARLMLSAATEDFAGGVAGVISDGQHPIRQAVARVFPGVPHQLRQFHYLREAALPIYEADRHAKKELKKRGGATD